MGRQATISPADRNPANRGPVADEDEAKSRQLAADGADALRIEEDQRRRKREFEVDRGRDIATAKEFETHRIREAAAIESKAVADSAEDARQQRTPQVAVAAGARRQRALEAEAPDGRQSWRRPTANVKVGPRFTS